MGKLREFWIEHNSNETGDESYVSDKKWNGLPGQEVIHVIEVVEPQIRDDLTSTEIKFINESDRCECGHLDIFHTDEVGACLIEDCKDTRCGNGP